ncbi:MAG TPA: hypothetical protein VFX48_08190 [Saprospiraceae bacterium]|nr:hypothetical protein [Saprospiraceae bacterium]
MKKGIMMFGLGVCLFWDLRLPAQCGVFCEDVTLTIPSCEALDNREELLSIGGDCNYLLFDQEGNRVPIPIPADIRYVCQNLTLYSFNGGDTCKSNVYIGLTTTLTVHPPEFRSLSIRNYELHNEPGPRVEGCTWQLRERIVVTTDEFIEICNVIPKVVRTYDVIDRCGNRASATHAFDLVGDISCHILGANRVAIGSGLELKSQYTPKGFKPFNTSWKVIGQDWSIQPNKLDPSKAVLTPGPIPGQATVVMDVFDRLGCSRRCEKVISSYISKGGLNPRQSSGSEFEMIVLYDEIQMRFSDDQFVETVWLMDITGNTIDQAKVPVGSTTLSLPLEQLIPGIYFVQLLNGKAVETRTFYKF